MPKAGVAAKIAQVPVKALEEQVRGAKPKKNRKDRRKDLRKEKRRDIKKRVKEERIKL